MSLQRVSWHRLRRAAIPGSIVFGIILILFASSNPAYHYLEDHRIPWRGWLAIIGGISVLAGVAVVIVRRFRQRTKVLPSARSEAQTPSRRDWVVITASSLPGIAAVVALLFTGLQVRATNGQLQATKNQLSITEQGQITDRYNAAIANLGSSSIDIRLGGIYALQRLMQDSQRDRQTVIAVLCAFAREPAAPNPEPQAPSAPSQPVDVQAAITVVGTRPAHDHNATLIDLNHAPLAGAQLEGLRLAGADLAGADLADANLNYTLLAAGTNLSSADLSGADLVSTQLAGANLAGANLTMAHLTSTHLAGANLRNVNLTGAVFAGADLRAAFFSGADLTGADLAGETLPHLSFGAAILTGADLSGTDLTGGYFVAAELPGANLDDAKLPGADLTGADLTGAHIEHADLTGANLSYANLTDADLYYDATVTSADLTGANLTGAQWPRSAIPEGWQRNPQSHRLERVAR